MNALEQRPEDDVWVHVCGPGEWIVGPAESGRPLHVYRLAAADWLVSEVGRDTEGHGVDLRRALAGLAATVPRSDWWELAAQALEGSEAAA